MRVSKLVLPIVLVVVVSGCGGKKKEGQKPEAAGAPSAAAEPASPAEPNRGSAAPRDENASPSLDKFRIGRDQGPDGTVVAETDRLTPSEKLFVSFVVRNPWPQTEVKVTWSSLKTTKVVAEETKALPASGLISFEAAGAGTWERGAYRLDISFSAPGKPAGALGRKDFELVTKK